MCALNGRSVKHRCGSCIHSPEEKTWNLKTPAILRKNPSKRRSTENQKKALLKHLVDYKENEIKETAEKSTTVKPTVNSSMSLPLKKKTL